MTMRNDGHQDSVCALCLKVVPELRRSHILPEPFYLNAYDAKGRYPIFSSSGSRPLGKLEQMGLRERLLGQCCETKLSAWETYALGLMWNRSPEEGIDQGAYYEFKVDYEKQKLFLLSLLWRMGVAKHQVFSEVQLGPKHLGRLHEMLRNSDPGREHEYVCHLAAIASSEEKLSSLLILPKRIRLPDGQSCYDLFARGFLWQFLVSSHRNILPDHEISLYEDGRMKVLKKNTVPPERYMPGIEAVLKSNAEFFIPR